MDRHIITSAWRFGLISLALCLVNPAAAQVDQQRAEAYFKEAAAICQRGGGRLWGVSLCGPTVFADARTRVIRRVKLTLNGKNSTSQMLI